MFLHMGMVISSHLRSSSRPLDAAAKQKSETRSQNVTAITARDWSSNCSCFLLVWRFCTVWSIACQPLSFDKQYWQTDISQSEDSPTLVNSPTLFFRLYCAIAENVVRDVIGRFYILSLQCSTLSILVIQRSMAWTLRKNYGCLLA